MANGGIIGPVTTIVKSSGGNSVSKFTSPGTFAPGGSGTKLLDVLVVAGGGGGGATKGAPNNSAAGGGGGGGVLFLTNVPNTNPAPVSVTIGCLLYTSPSPRD